MRQAPASAVRRRKDMTVKRMDNVLIVVDDLEAAKAFFIELGLKLEGETTVEGPSVGSLIGLKDVRATLAMMRTPDGQGIELDKFLRAPWLMRASKESCRGRWRRARGSPRVERPLAPAAPAHRILRRPI